MNFIQKLEEAIQISDSTLCVGLDPNLSRIPHSIKKQYPSAEEQVRQFLLNVIDVTSDHCAAYKPNLGFFEALGADGLRVFQDVLNAIPAGKIIIADAKRGDISSTAEHYAKAYFEQFNVDAITLSPLMGFETLDPFLDYPEKAVFALTLTSNPGAADFLKKPFAAHDSMAAYIADVLAGYDKKHATHIGMVVGATQAKKLQPVLENHTNGALLIPGIGAQGGSINELSTALKNHSGIPLISSSRSILYAGEHKQDWQQAVAKQAASFKKALQPITQRYV